MSTILTASSTAVLGRMRVAMTGLREYRRHRRLAISARAELIAPPPSARDGPDQVGCVEYDEASLLPSQKASTIRTSAVRTRRSTRQWCGIAATSPDGDQR